jgi:hypothetical protein
MHGYYNAAQHVYNVGQVSVQKCCCLSQPDASSFAAFYCRVQFDKSLMINVCMIIGALVEGFKALLRLVIFVIVSEILENHFIISSHGKTSGRLNM